MMHPDRRSVIRAVIETALEEDEIAATHQDWRRKKAERLLDALAPLFVMDDSEESLRIIKMADERGDFVRENDGFYVYWPKRPDAQGFSEAWHLRALADHLDLLNLPLRTELDRDLGKPLAPG